MNFFTRFILCLLGITIRFNGGLCDTLTSRAIDISMPWRPIPQQSLVNPGQQHHLISVANLDGTNQAQLMQIAQHNAQIMRKLKNVAAKQQMSSTQFYNTYQSSTPSYHNRYMNDNNNNKQQQFLGKQEYQNYLKITSTAPKIQHISNNKHQFSAGNYRVLNSTPNLRNEVSLTPPPLPHPTQKAYAQKQHPVISKLQAHLALAQLQHSVKQPQAEQSTRQENYVVPSSLLNTFSKYAQPSHIRDYNQGKTQNFAENDLKHFKAPSVSTTKNYYGNQYLPPSNLSAEHFVLQNLPINSQLNSNTNKQPYKYSFQSTVTDHESNSGGFVSHGNFPSIPPSVLSPFFQQVQQQQNENDNNKNIDDYFTVTQKTEINDEFTKHLVPPPPYKKQPQHNVEHSQKQNTEVFNKFVPNYSQQDSNRYVYNTGPLSQQVSSSNQESQTTESPTFSGYLFPPSTDPPINFNSFGTTNKPFVFKTLNQSTENAFKQHKLLHPSYTGAKRPNEQQYQQQQQQHPQQEQQKQQPSHTTFLPTPFVPEENSAITHAFFTIEDAVTLSPHSIGSLNIHGGGGGKHQHQINFKPTKNYEYEIENYHQQPNVVTESPDILFEKQRFQDQEKPTQNIDSELSGYDSYLVSSTALPTTGRPFFTTIATTTTSYAPPTTTPPPPSESSETFNSVQPLEKIKMRRRRPKPAQVHLSKPEINHQEEVSVPSSAGPQLHQRPRNQQQNRGNRPLRNRRPIKQQEQQEQDVRDHDNNQYHKEVIRRPMTTQESKINHFLPTVHSTSEIDVDKNLISLASTQQSLFPETTTDIKHFNKPSAAFYTTTHVNPAAVEISNPNQPLPTNGPNDIVTTISSPTTTVFKNINFPRKTQYQQQQHQQQQDGTVHINRRPIALSTTTTTESPQPTKKSHRLKPIVQFDTNNRPRFSVKEYRQRLSTSTTESNTASPEPTEHTRLRFPTRNRFLAEPIKQKQNPVEELGQIEATTLQPVYTDINEIQYQTTSVEPPRKRYPPKERKRFSTPRPTTQPSPVYSSTTTTTTIRPTTSRRRVNTRRDFINRNRNTAPVTQSPETQSPVIRNSSFPLRRPPPITLRQKIQNRKKEEENLEPEVVIEDIKNNVSEVDNESDNNVENFPSVAPESVTDGYRHETSIMKIAKDDHSYRPYAHSTTTETTKFNENYEENDLAGAPSDYSQRVAELTISANNNFKSVNTGILSRRVPGYFTLATEDPILPIEAFFPQIKGE